MFFVIKGFVLACLVGQLLGQNLLGNSVFSEREQTSDFVRRYGYPAEEHQVKTNDSYILTIFRIPHDRLNSSTDRPVVLLQHGIILNSDQWVFRGPGSDLVFSLSDSGYDVWMSNTRGTDYSSHEDFSNRDPEFWNYAVTETGMYDLAAIIDYILKTTEKPHLTYIGHSRANSMLVILLSMQPEFNSKINLYLGLAPVVYSRQTRTALFRPAATGPFSVTSSSAVRDMMNMARISNIFRLNRGIRQMTEVACNPLSLLTGICSSVLFLISGDDAPMYNRSLTPLIIKRFTMGMSAKEYIHLLQIKESDIFRQYDYGRSGNLNAYGQAEPPTFDIGQVRVPSYLYYGPNDFFVSERDLFKFALQLPNLKGVYRIPFDKFNHVDYMWAKVADTLLYPKLIETIDEYNKK